VGFKANNPALNVGTDRSKPAQLRWAPGARYAQAIWWAAVKEEKGCYSHTRT